MLHTRMMRVDWPGAVLVEQEDPGQAARQFVRRVIEADESTGSRPTLDTELVAAAVTDPAATPAGSQVQRDDARYHSSHVSVRADFG